MFQSAIGTSGLSPTFPVYQRHFPFADTTSGLGLRKIYTKLNVFVALTKA